jgi:hypothetical protein
MSRSTICAVFLSALTVSVGTRASTAPIIYASGQLLVENTAGTHDDVRENRIYVIDTSTGIASPLPIWSNPTPAALGGARGTGLLGFNAGQFGSVNPFVTNGFTPLGGPAGVAATAFDVLADGRAFVVTTSGNRQLYEIDRTTGIASAIGSAGQIAAALDAEFGLASGTSRPFVISLGSVGDTLYGVNLETGRQNLIAINPNTGAATVIGAADAVDANDLGRYSGYAALTGVDEDADGQFDALFGAVNFWDHDGDPGTSDVRLGGIARYDLSDGTWQLVGTNPGVIFFGFGSVPIPEPTTLLLVTAAGVILTCGRGRRFAAEPDPDSRRSRRYRSNRVDVEFASSCVGAAWPAEQAPRIAS